MALDFLLLCFIAGIFVGSALPVLPSVVVLVWILFVSLLVLLLYIPSYPATSWFNKGRRYLLCLACFGFGLAWAIYDGHQLFAQRLADQFAGEDFLVEGVVINLPEPTERGERFDLVVEQVLHAPASFNQQQSLKKLRLNSYDNNNIGIFSYQPGQRWRLTVRLKPPRGSVNPYAFDYEGWLLQEGYSAVGYVHASTENILLDDKKTTNGLLKIKMVFDRWGFTSLQWINTHIESLDQRALFAAIAIGYKEEFTRHHWELLKDTGTIHLVVVSGLNIVLAATVGFFLFGWLSRLLFFPLYLLPAPVWGAMGAMLLAVFYAGITGLSLPTQRSLIMVLCGLMTLLLRRKISVQSGFLIALAGVLVLDPLAGFTASLWLSFGAVGILLYCFSSRIFVHKNFISQWLRTQMFVSLGLFPLLAYWMGSVPLVMPLANLFAVPFATFVLLPLTIISGLVFSVSPMLGSFVLKICGYGMDLFWWFLQLMQSINVNWHMTMGDFSSGELPSFIALCLSMTGVLIILAPRGVLPRWLGLFLFLPLLIPAQHKLPEGEFALTVIDVGQGLSVLVETRNTATVYDVGDKYSDQFDIGRDVVAQLVRRKGYDHVDNLIISHSDSDHAGGLQGLLGELQARRLLSGTADTIQQRLTGHFANTVEPCLRGQSWVIDAVHFDVLSPDNNFPESKPNQQSCVIKISNAHTSVLLTGDIERDREQWLLSQGDSLKASVLVVPHHGSKTSSSAEFLQAVDPELALVSVGYKSQYGHPHREVVQRYQERNIPFWRTDQSGALLWRSFGENPLRASRLEELGYWHRW